MVERKDVPVVRLVRVALVVQAAREVRGGQQGALVQVQDRAWRHSTRLAAHYR
jgi:hypothetical protein